MGLQLTTVAAVTEARATSEAEVGAGLGVGARARARKEVGAGEGARTRVAAAAVVVEAAAAAVVAAESPEDRRLSRRNTGTTLCAVPTVSSGGFRLGLRATGQRAAASVSRSIGGRRRRNAPTLVEGRRGRLVALAVVDLGILVLVLMLLLVLVLVVLLLSPDR